ncbi:MAG: sortase [Rubrobacter sp.]|nr:sortase [Rubrobacter sp.]MDQ3637120.1 sortase [Actinomycetota bacterium]
MLLKVGTAMMLSALALALVVAAVVAFSGPAEETASQAASVEPVSSGATEREKRAFDPGEKLEIDDPEPPEETKKAAERPKQREAQTLPVAPDAWPAPSGQEVAAAREPRYYPQRQDGVLTLTVEGIGLYDVPVINANNQEALDNGVIHFPQTPMPWEERDQKNVYLAGHRLGFPNTGSRLVFYNLDKLKEGDSIVLQDSLGEPYEYQVSEVFVVEPDADWAVDPVRGRDMVTLQTCTFPDLLNRLIVRADRA